LPTSSALPVLEFFLLDSEAEVVGWKIINYQE